MEGGILEAWKHMYERKVMISTRRRSLAKRPVPKLRANIPFSPFILVEPKSIVRRGNSELPKSKVHESSLPRIAATTTTTASQQHRHIIMVGGGKEVLLNIIKNLFLYFSSAVRRALIIV